ncbi:MAG: AMP-binding protein [Candidatus Pelagadaptatus aseana]|uniref:AMP-binding protein n=1 Tax=Candidatus Pelagadaptatus aseana TaxID=3120508 RepID=UPI0039B1E109
MTNNTVAQTPLDCFYYWESTKPDAVYLSQPTAGQWCDYSWGEVGQQARKAAACLQAMGIKQGERVCILSKNCAHWMIADLAIMMSGGASAPAFTSMSADDVLYILEHSGSKVLIVGETDNWDQIKDCLPEGLAVISLPGMDIPQADIGWAQLLENFEPVSGNPARALDDELTTIYTSGSTGKPKGVMYDFEGAYHVALNLGDTYRMTEDDIMISYLPMAHGFERAVVDWMSLLAGYRVGFNESLTTFAEDMKQVRPTVFQCVPRLWTKFQEGVVAKFGGQDILSGKLADSEQSDAIKLAIKQGLGLDRARLCLTGSAPTPMPLHQWYEALDMPQCEIYGQSEVLSGTSNLPWDRKAGTLGKPTCHTDIKISDIGEILIRARAMMTGYLNEPEKTAETLIDGWIHTGDKGEIDADGFLRITGRIKEIFKTAKGKYVAPVPIEGHFVSNPYIEQVCLIGNGLPQTVLTLQLSEIGKNAAREVVAAEIGKQVVAVNESLGAHEKMAGIVISAQDWSSANGRVTHTMKIKRQPIEQYFQPLAEGVFAESSTAAHPAVIWE